MKLSLDVVSRGIVRSRATRELIERNGETVRFGLRLSEKDALMVADSLIDDLREQKRIELAGGIAPALIDAFCDSLYLMQETYAETLCELQSAFYLYKEESEDLMSDDELIAMMRECFDEGKEAMVKIEREKTASGRSDLAIKDDPSPTQLYDIGYRVLVAKAKRALSEYNVLAATFDDYGMEEYGITFREEIPEALSAFDPRFHSVEEPVFSYPMPGNHCNFAGIDAILGAVERIAEEQAFLSHLTRTQVCKVAAEASAWGENLYAAVLAARDR